MNTNFDQMVYSYRDFTPVIDESAFIHPLASVIGNVIIGKNVYVGPFASIRGDLGRIVIGDGSNIQDNCTIHMFPGVEVILGNNVHVGHGAIIHGASIEKDVLIGMNCVIMDDVYIETECIIGAMSFVKTGMKIPARSLLVGNPAKIVKQVSDKMLDWKIEGTQLYMDIARFSNETLTETQPLREIPENQPKQEILYKTWKNS